jgi:hypothetical protein
LVGFVVDHASPGWGFALAGVGGVAVAAFAAALAARHADVEIPQAQQVS